MARQVSLSDDVIRELDKLKKGRSYSVVIADLLRGQRKTALDQLNDAFFEGEDKISGILGEEMKEALEMLRILSIRLLKKKEEGKSITADFGRLLDKIDEALQEIISQEDQES